MSGNGDIYQEPQQILSCTKEKNKQTLDFYKVKNKVELKVKLEKKRRRKFSNSRYHRGNSRIAN
jgi:hypothetical protein